MDEALSYAMERKAFGKPIIEVHTGNTQTAQPASLCTLHIIAALLGSCMANPHTSTKECPSRLPIWPLGLSLLVWCATEAPGRLTRVAETPTTPPSQKPWQLTWPTRLQRMLYRWACSHTGTHVGPLDEACAVLLNASINAWHTHLVILRSACLCLVLFHARVTQIFGGNGYNSEYPVEKLMRDAKIFQVGGAVYDCCADMRTLPGLMSL